MKTTVTIEIEIKGQTLKLTKEEANELYEALGDVLEIKTFIPSSPYQDPFKLYEKVGGDPFPPSVRWTSPATPDVVERIRVTCNHTREIDI